MNTSSSHRILILVAASVFPLVGCSSSGDSVFTSKAARTVDVDAFANPANRSDSETTVVVADSSESTPTPGEPTVDVTTGGDVNTVAPIPLGAGSEPPPAAVRTDRQMQTGEAVVVESLIGQVNGRPVYASEFFEPIEDQLVALAEEFTTTRQWFQRAQRIVQQRLEDVVLSELYLAQAESTLTPEEQQGLFALIRSVQEQTQALGGGTKTGAEKRVLEVEGMSYDEFIELQKNRALIRKVLAEKIRPRVIVSWRDVERAYYDNFDQFNPPATLSIARMYVATEPDGVEPGPSDVQVRIDSGEPFAQIAESLGFRNGGAWQDELTMRQGDVETLELQPVMREALRGLGTSDVSKPFVIGNNTWWLQISSLEQPEGRSLYDPEVQRALQNALFQQRHAIEENRYIRSLFEKGITDEMSSMGDRLMDIAITRYGPR